MITLNFGTFPEMTVQDGLVPVPKARLDVINLMTEKQKAKGLIPMTTKSGEIMWVHPDIFKTRVGDQQTQAQRLTMPSLS